MVLNVDKPKRHFHVHVPLTVQNSPSAWLTIVPTEFWDLGIRCGPEDKSSGVNLVPQDTT